MLYQDQPVLTVSNACHNYGNRKALQGVSLELWDGELLGLLGPNGAGKTTFINSLAGRIELKAGAIRHHLEGDPRDLIGVVPQEIALYQDLTVLQNLDVFARLQGIRRRKIAARIDHALGWSKLGDRKNSLVRTLSGGMQRRLNIACSVLHDPAILLLDEPTVGVDPQSRESIYEMLDQLLDAGTAVLLTTHHLEEAQDRCDRIAIIDHGQIVATGSFEELLQETVGVAQQVFVRFSSPISRVPKPLKLGPHDDEAHCEVSDVSRQLPDLLSRLERLKLPVADLSLRAPSLQHVFLHLTGKELRE